MYKKLFHITSSICFVITIWDFIFQIVPIKGNSMKPTIMDKDLVLSQNWLVFFSKYKRQNIIVLKSPNKQGERIIKRLIGLPGDIIFIDNEKEIENLEYYHSTTTRTTTNHGTYIKIPSGYCWIEGDNNETSIDSRNYGIVPLGLLEGVVTHVIWPPNHWKKLNVTSKEKQNKLIIPNEKS